MSNTRSAKGDGPLRQERYCSSPEFERGLMANLVARRCSVLDRADARELIWFLQHLSHQAGGIRKLATELCRMFPERLATPAMQALGTRPGQVYHAEQVRKVRAEIPGGDQSYLLKGEDSCLWELGDGEPDPDRHRRPNSYPAGAFAERCRAAAAESLEEFLIQLCLDPAVPVADGRPWYFPSLLKSVRDYQTAWIAERQLGRVTTEIGQCVNEALEYALESRRMVLIDGPARIGKSHAAKAWCAQRPGKARYVQVPSTNDEIGFFRALAQSLGVSVESNPKAQKLRARIEGALQSGDLMLVLDEGHYLWPQSNYRHATPSRITWLMTALINAGVPVAVVTTPQFFRSQKAVEKRTCWTAEQLTGRIGHFESLPAIPSDHDLALVARAALGESNERAVAYLVDYAKASKRYLAGIDAVVSRARYVVRRANRETVTAADVRQAIQSSVIPSDSALVGALESTEKPPQKRAGNRVSEPFQAGRFAERSAAISKPVESLLTRGQLAEV